MVAQICVCRALADTRLVRVVQVAALTELLVRHPGIKRLFLTNNALDDAMVALLLETISSGVTSIDTLMLNNNELTWLTCERMAPLLQSRPTSAGSGGMLNMPPFKSLQVGSGSD